MTPVPLEDRVAVVEREIARLKLQVEQAAAAPQPWWERITGVFADDPAFDEAMRLGRAYRESLRASDRAPEGEADVPA